jgi:gluconolactonase
MGVMKPVIGAACAALFALVGGPSAMAAPDCAPQPAKRTVLSGQGRLESVISDRRGRIFFTDAGGGRLLRVDRPGAASKVLATIPGPGGLAFDDAGNLIVGSRPGGNQSEMTGGAQLVRVNPETGAKSVHASGLGAANGVVRGPDGAYYVSNDFSTEIDRVVAGKVTRNWTEVLSPNGLAVDRANRYLYAAQTFKPPSISRVEVARPELVTEYSVGGPEDTFAGLDGMTRDDSDRLIVAANGGGQVWLVDTARDLRTCVLARGILTPSNVGFGGGGPGFSERNLYVVDFAGELIELADVRSARVPASAPPGRLRRSSRPRLKISLKPRRAVVGRRTRFRIRVRVGRRPVSGARVRFAGRKRRTGRRGLARFRLRFRRPGRYRVRASRRGYRGATRSVRVIRRR